MKILITGGAGFIGTNLVCYLADRKDHHLTILDDLSACQSQPRLPARVTFIQGDFTEPDVLDRALEGVEVIVHLAAQSGVMESISDPVSSFNVNVEGSFRLFERARLHGVGNIIVASTSGALLRDVTPPINEALPPSPLSPYGATKAALEAFCSAYTGSYGLRCTALRFSNIYGPHSSHKKTVIATFIKQILMQEPLVVYGDGTQQRDYLYVGDLVRGIASAIDRGVTGTYQLGSGGPTSLLALLRVLERIYGRQLNVRFEKARKGEVHSTWCSIDKARGGFGFAASTSLEDGVRATWNWFAQNRETWTRQKVPTTSD